MSFIARNRRYRIAYRRTSEQGLTLIELLLSLAILAILTSFLVGGLAMARRALDADRVNEIGSETSAAIQTISSLIGSALPIPANDSHQKKGIRFEGGGELLSFVGLSEGRSLQGGLYAIVLRRSGGDLVVDFVAFTEAVPTHNILPPTRVVALSGVREIHLGYFGSPDPSVPPGWRTEWTHAERLPELVSVRIDFSDERRNEPATIIALRQG